MPLMWIGAALVIAGILVSTITTLRRGRLSQAEQPVTHEPRDTLEPQGKGRRLSLKADLPGLAMIALGFILLLASGFLGGPR